MLWVVGPACPCAPTAPGVPPGPCHSPCGKILKIHPRGPVSLLVGNTSQRLGTGRGGLAGALPSPAAGAEGHEGPCLAADSGPAAAGAFKCVGLGPLRLRWPPPPLPPCLPPPPPRTALAPRPALSFRPRRRSAELCLGSGRAAKAGRCGGTRG